HLPPWRLAMLQGHLESSMAPRWLAPAMDALQAAGVALFPGAGGPRARAPRGTPSIVSRGMHVRWRACARPLCRQNPIVQRPGRGHGHRPGMAPNREPVGGLHPLGSTLSVTESPALSSLEVASVNKRGPAPGAPSSSLTRPFRPPDGDGPEPGVW